jgi:hypothetical protein
MPSEIAEVGAADGEEISIFVESELGLDREIAALIIAEKCFAAFAGPLYRPADTPCRPTEKGVLGIKEVPPGSETLTRTRA